MLAGLAVVFCTFGFFVQKMQAHDAATKTAKKHVSKKPSHVSEEDGTDGGRDREVKESRISSGVLLCVLLNLGLLVYWVRGGLQTMLLYAGALFALLALRQRLFF